MKNHTQHIEKLIDRQKEELISISKKIWGYAEPALEENKSSALLKEYLIKNDFIIKLSNKAYAKQGFIHCILCSSAFHVLIKVLQM